MFSVPCIFYPFQVSQAFAAHFKLCMFSFVWSECLCVCACMLRTVSRDKILCFKNTFIIIIIYFCRGRKQAFLLWTQARKNSGIRIRIMQAANRKQSALNCWRKHNSVLSYLMPDDLVIQSKSPKPMWTCEAWRNPSTCKMWKIP